MIEKTERNKGENDTARREIMIRLEGRTNK